jgi:hypothetical protein
VTPQPLTRAEFNALLEEQQALIGLVNDLEYRLYSLGDTFTQESVNECRQSAGTLVGALRSFLYRQDQQVLPIVEASVESRCREPSGNG